MPWREAFKRAFGVFGALVVLALANFLIFGLGAGLIVTAQSSRSDTGPEVTIVGVILLIAGTVLSILCVLAIYIKVMTDAVSDHVMERIRNERMNL